MQSAFVSAYFKIVEQSENNFDTIFSLAAQPHFDRHDSTVSLSTKSPIYSKSKCLNKPTIFMNNLSPVCHTALLTILKKKVIISV